MNNILTVKYGLEPEYTEKMALESESFKIKFDFHRLEKVKKNNKRLKRYGQKIDQTKKFKLRETLNVGEEFQIFAERMKKKIPPRKFYKSSVENKSCFNKNGVFLKVKKHKIDGINFFRRKILKRRNFREKIPERGSTCSLSCNFI